MRPASDEMRSDALTMSPKLLISMIVAKQPLATRSAVAPPLSSVAGAVSGQAVHISPAAPQAEEQWNSSMSVWVV